MQLVFCSDTAQTSYWNYSKKTLFSVPADSSSHNAASYCIQVAGWALLLHLANFGFRYACFLSMGNRLKPC